MAHTSAAQSMRWNCLARSGCAQYSRQCWLCAAGMELREQGRGALGGGCQVNAAPPNSTRGSSTRGSSGRRRSPVAVHGVQRVFQKGHGPIGAMRHLVRIPIAGQEVFNLRCAREQGSVGAWIGGRTPLSKECAPCRLPDSPRTGRQGAGRAKAPAARCAASGGRALHRPQSCRIRPRPLLP